MIYLPCGWDVQRHLIKRGGCGAWLGREAPHPWGKPFSPLTPHFRNGIAYCQNCYKSFDVVHLGLGICVRPRQESDVPVGGPSLEELYT